MRSDAIIHVSGLSKVFRVLKRKPGLLGGLRTLFSLDFFIGLMAFWTYSIWGLAYAKMAMVDVLAGTIVLLSLFPGWLERIAMALPFRGIAYVPLSIYTGAIRGTDIWKNILVQLVWGVALILLTRLIWLRARRRLVVQGGSACASTWASTPATGGYLSRRWRSIAPTYGL